MVKYNITLDPKLPHLHHLLLQHLVADSIKIPVLHDYTLYPKNFVSHYCLFSAPQWGGG